MSVITFPETLKVAEMSWAQLRRDISFSSVLGSQAVEISTPLWDVTVTSIDMNESDSGEWKALMMKMRGQTNQLELWNLARPVPRGTMRGSMKLTSSISAGATTLSITAIGEGTKTLLAGDLLGIGLTTTTQVVMVTALATSSVGVISVIVEPPVRNAHLINADVTWDKPKILFRRKQSEARWEYSNIVASGFTLDLIEDVRP